jgi:hypothetical protein
MISFLEVFRPILALKLAESANVSNNKKFSLKLRYGHHKTQKSLKPLKKRKKFTPKSY